MACSGLGHSVLLLLACVLAAIKEAARKTQVIKRSSLKKQAKNSRLKVRPTTARRPCGALWVQGRRAGILSTVLCEHISGGFCGGTSRNADNYRDLRPSAYNSVAAHGTRLAWSDHDSCSGLKHFSGATGSHTTRCALRRRSSRW